MIKYKISEVGTKVFYLQVTRTLFCAKSRSGNILRAPRALMSLLRSTRCWSQRRCHRTWRT